MNKKEILKEKIKLLKQLDLNKNNYRETFSQAEKKGLTEDYLKGNKTSQDESTSEKVKKI